MRELSIPTLSPVPPVPRVPRVIGCDVGKATITVFDTASGRTSVLDNDATALSDFARSLPTDSLIVCEATGGYEAALLMAATEAGVPAHRACARKVKAFIRSRGRLGKTDAIDAHGLARYGQERHAELPRWQPPAGVRDDLRTLVRLRRDLVTQRTALGNQLKAPLNARAGAIARVHLQTLIDAVSARITAIEADIRDLVDRDPDIAEIVGIIEHVPGCGAITALSLAALMPELGTTTGRRITSLAGLAPHPYDSGQRSGYRRTRGGRPEVKQALFMAAMAARNHNPELKAFYTRLVKKGKKPLVALTAVMRKLITIINARVRDARLLKASQTQPAN